MGIGWGPAPETVDLSAQYGWAEGGGDPALELIWRGRKNRSSNVERGRRDRVQGAGKPQGEGEATGSRGPRAQDDSYGPHCMEVT